MIVLWTKLAIVQRVNPFNYGTWTVFLLGVLHHTCRATTKTFQALFVTSCGWPARGFPVDIVTAHARTCSVPLLLFHSTFSLLCTLCVSFDFAASLRQIVVLYFVIVFFQKKKSKFVCQLLPACRNKKLKSAVKNRATSLFNLENEASSE